MAASLIDGAAAGSLSDAAGDAEPFLRGGSGLQFPPSAGITPFTIIDNGYDLFAAAAGVGVATPDAADKVFSRLETLIGSVDKPASSSLAGGTFTKQGDGTYNLATGTASATTLNGTVTGVGFSSATAGTDLLDPGGIAARYGSSPSPLLGGKLALNSSLDDDIRVGAAGTLGGIGGFLDSLTATSTITPANGLGTVNFTGDYTRAADSTYKVSAAGTVSSRIQAPLNIWISVLGGLSPATSGGTGAFSNPFGGTAIGIDYRIDPRFQVGAAADCSAGDRPLDGFGGPDWTDTTSLAAYGSFSQGNFRADAIAGYGTFGNGLLRQVSFPGLAPRSADGAAMPHDTAMLGFQAKTVITGNSQAYFRYNGEVGDGMDSHALTVGLRLNW